MISDSKDRMIATRSAAWLVLAAALVTFVGLRARVLSVPLERDEGEYAYIAQRMFASDVPYRDAFIQKTPGTVFVYAAAFQFFGQSVETIHLTLYLWTAVTACLLYLLVKALSDDLAAALAVLAFVVVSVEPRLLATAANTEQFALLPLTGGFLAYLYAVRSGRRLWWLISGASCIGAFWFKQVALVPVMLIPLAQLASVVTGRSRVDRSSLIRGSVWLAGGVAVSIPMVAS